MNAASPKIVITDCDHDNIEPEQRVFAEAGFDVWLAECKTASDVIEQAREADALINQYAPIDESVLAHLMRCRIVVDEVEPNSYELHTVSGNVWERYSE